MAGVTWFIGGFLSVASIHEGLLHALQLCSFRQYISQLVCCDAIADTCHVCPHIARRYGPQGLIDFTIGLSENHNTVTDQQW